MLLLLFDIDGTLLQRASHEHALALREAAGAVHGVDVLEIDTVEYAGRTDIAIARDLLAAAGVTDVDAHWDQVRSRAATAYERLCPPDLSAKVAPGRVPALAGHRQSGAGRAAEARAGRRRALLRAGPGRVRLRPRGPRPPARDRAGARLRSAVPRERTVVIGDTPRDIECARVDEVRVAAVATGQYPVTALADADAVVDDARALAPVLADLA